MSSRFGLVLGPVARLALVFATATGATSASAAGQPASDGAGVIEGRVVDATTGNPLPGATVFVTGSAAQASTNRDGVFLIAGVPAGDRSVVVMYLGRQDEVIETKVVAGATQRLEVKMRMVAFEEAVTVTAEALILESQERALNQQKAAPNITNIVAADQIGSFPDRNAAETTQRIPGVSITKDQGEGRYVNIRGTEPRLNAMMIDGQRIPSPDPLLRQVAVDVVPSELLQSIEVSKALTPDMDGDSIGGSVNLVMKQAPEKLRLFGSVGGGYNEMLSSYRNNNYSFTGGRRFDGGKMGLIVSGSGSETTRGNQDMEVVYTPTLTLNELNPRWYQVHRKRVGFTGAYDVKPNNDATFTVRGVFNRFIDDHENRQRVRYAVANRRIDRELRDRTHIERISSLSFTGQQILNGSTTIDYQLLGAYSDQNDPLTMTTVFRHANINFLPNVTATSIDPDNIQANPQNEVLGNYNFNSQLRAVNFSMDRDIVGMVNVRRPLSSSTSATSLLKVGFKMRDKAKGRNRNEVTYTTPSTLKLTDFIETGFDLPPYLDGRYNLEPYTSQSAVEGILSRAPFTGAVNHARDAENFDGTERTYAGYAMAEIYAGQKLFLLPGLRYEYTTDDFTGRNIRFGTGGAWLGSDPIQSKANYGVPMPAFHVKYAATPNTNVRFAVTRTIARPNYSDVLATRSQDDTALIVVVGNPDLHPTKAWNLDGLFEHYFKSVGVVSGGVFYKKLTDYIYTFTLQQQINGTQYQVTQPLNGDAATVAGFEVALQNQLRFLPSPFDGIGIYGNYTFSDSTAHFPQHSGDSTLPGQSRHVGNLAASYEKAGFVGRVSVNFHGSYIDVVGADNTQDRFYDTNKQLDASITQKLTRNFRAYVNVLNLNDSLLRYYQSVTERVLQEEHYHWWTEFGIKVEF
jgi:TonB-dependent receptor